MFRANALYEGTYLLGTSIARPLISKHLVDIAEETGADAVAHGATGKGNDQVRFELSAYALNPNIKVIAPWRDWSFKSRTELLDFAERHQIPIAKDKRGEAPFSVDANLLHSSSEGGSGGSLGRGAGICAPAHDLADGCARQGHRDRHRLQKGRCRRAERQGAVTRRDAHCFEPTRTRQRHRPHRSGGNRFVGMKSRGVYETPGGTILIAAHRAIESITLDRGAGHLKDELMPRYAELIYNGFWFSPEREMLQALIDKSQEDVEGEVRLKLYKGNVIVTGRRSSKSLYRNDLVTFEDDRGAYDQKDAEGFIRLNALRLRTLAARGRKG
jgi:argininosuccinate synthase